QTTVQADGRWQLNVPAADVGALTDGNVTVTATVSDVAGNSSRDYHRTRPGANASTRYQRCTG
ncbi:Ig-like domain-containing protein, partial [Enterobacter hormaechei]